MIYERTDALIQRIELVTGRRLRDRPEVHEDTSRYNIIASGSVVRLEDNDYFILRDLYEGRFGLDDQPKFWVKSAIDLESGAQKVIKFVFRESFTARFGALSVECRRSAGKESRILAHVRNNPYFMQGITVHDRAGNPVRLIDFIGETSLYHYILDLQMPHRRYYETLLPSLLGQLIASIEALEELHRAGLYHGDVRNDHLIIDPQSGRLVWIDFDYEVNLAAEFDVLSMGNVLTFVVGLGMQCFHDLATRPGRDDMPAVDERDALSFYRYRIANLRKLFPYISRELNDVLLRFSVGGEPYRDLASLVVDLRAAMRHAGA